MSPAHPEPAMLESYAMGIDDDLAVEAIESHLRTCPLCTEELRRQAQLELALTETASEARFCPGCNGLLATSRCEACGAAAEVNGFEVLRVLVQNAHGRMYLARDAHGQVVALKELAFVQPPHPDAVAAFEREARLLRQLAHPQIPRFVGDFSHGQGVQQRLYLAQEYVEGESLSTRLAHHQFSEAEAREIAGQVLDILVYLQGLSPMVFHRDIKPANLVRRPDGRIALVDFGAARDLGATAGATLVGTFGYMPVEQLGGLVNPTTDLYALGATLAQLLGRREPWSFLEDPEALGRLNVSPQFRRFLGKLLAGRPDDRFASAAQAAAALRNPGLRGDRPHRSWQPLLSLPTLLIASGAMAAGFFLFNASVRRPQSEERRHQAEEEAPVARAREKAAPLDRDQIVSGMNAIMPRARDCYAQFKVPGVATVKVTVSPAGRVSAATVTGRFAGTPSGACVENLVKTARFPPSAGRSFDYIVPLR